QTPCAWRSLLSTATAKASRPTPNPDFARKGCAPTRHSAAHAVVKRATGQDLFTTIALEPTMKKRDIGHIDLGKLPFQPRRCGFVLTELLAQHNWRHAVKDKGVSYDTMEDRRQFLFRTFAYLRDNPTKSFKLDPRSLSGRHVDFLFEHWEQRARAGELGPSSLQKIHSMLRTFAGWIGKPDLVKPLSAYIKDK